MVRNLSINQSTNESNMNVKAEENVQQKHFYHKQVISLLFFISSLFFKMDQKVTVN